MVSVFNLLLKLIHFIKLLVFSPVFYQIAALSGNQLVSVCSKRILLVIAQISMHNMLTFLSLIEISCLKSALAFTDNNSIL